LRTGYWRPAPMRAYIAPWTRVRRVCAGVLNDIAGQ
jgi:hypothetical protein